MTKPHAFLITVNTIKKDIALKSGMRGARKWLVTNLYSQNEKPATESIPLPPKKDEKCPVLIMKDTEVAVFTHEAQQDRHYHKQATEIYMLIEGDFTIEVEGEVYDLHAGDMIVINPGAVHEVHNSQKSFLCRVVTINCAGLSDKYI